MIDDKNRKKEISLIHRLDGDEKFKKNASIIIEEAINVLKDPPKTWLPYLEKQDYLGIAKMEVKEWSKAVELFEKGLEGKYGIKKESEHAIASILQAKAHLM